MLRERRERGLKLTALCVEYVQYPALSGIENAASRVSG